LKTVKIAPVQHTGSYVMDLIKDKICGETVVTGFCLLVFGVFFTVVISNLI